MDNHVLTEVGRDTCQHARTWEERGWYDLNDVLEDEVTCQKDEEQSLTVKEDELQQKYQSKKSFSVASQTVIDDDKVNVEAVDGTKTNREA